MAKTYDELICDINNISVQEIITKEFPGNITAARVGVRVSIIMNEINDKLDNLRSHISISLENQKTLINERFDQVEKNQIAICDKLEIELDEE
ncbi:MAG: hypothetical protein MI785_14365 [Kiloniellales bacterium]|nr:hypothetical protein [Kiloniellales bacterium]